MATRTRRRRSSKAHLGIIELRVAGFKSIRDEARIEVRPVTILAGANSSGKSSMIQPLLLLKQTLDASYEPGALAIEGPNVTFTAADQLLSRDSDTAAVRMGVGTPRGRVLLTYRRIGTPGRLDVTEMVIQSAGNDEPLVLVPGNLDRTLLKHHALSDVAIFLESLEALVGGRDRDFSVVRDRGFLAVSLSDSDSVSYAGDLVWNIRHSIQEAIHLPGLRDNPARNYRAMPRGPVFAGPFHEYVAGIVTSWQERKDETLEAVAEDLRKLGLTWKVSARPVSETHVELLVGRRLRPAQGGARDLVSIADVGLGVSQVLPVIVALRVAEPGQLVFLEQPEIHLHPRAQLALAEIVADAGRRGVRVVAETHSSLLILGLQTLVAKGELDPGLVKLHWFTRGDDGYSIAHNADLDRTGAFGDWPQDFDNVILGAQGSYLDAAHTRLASLHALMRRGA